MAHIPALGRRNAREYHDTEKVAKAQRGTRGEALGSCSEEGGSTEGLLKDGTLTPRPLRILLTGGEESHVTSTGCH